MVDPASVLEDESSDGPKLIACDSAAERQSVRVTCWWCLLPPADTVDMSRSPVRT